MLKGMFFDLKDICICNKCDIFIGYIVFYKVVSLIFVSCKI